MAVVAPWAFLPDCPLPHGGGHFYEARHDIRGNDRQPVYRLRCWRRRCAVVGCAEHGEDGAVTFIFLILIMTLPGEEPRTLRSPMADYYRPAWKRPAITSSAQVRTEGDRRSIYGGVLDQGGQGGGELMGEVCPVQSEAASRIPEDCRWPQ